MLVLAGKNNIAVNALNFIYENFGKDFLVTCNKTDTGEHDWQRSLRKTARDKGIREISLNEAYDIASVFISLEFDRLVIPAMFKNCRSYNIHFSLLPKYKGMYTSIWPLLNGEKNTGVTLHEIDHGIDTGKIIDQIEIPISETDRARDIYRKYLTAGFDLFKKNFSSIISGEINSKPQEKFNSSYYSKDSIDFSKFEIDLNQTAYNISRQIYAFSFREYQIPIVHGKKVVEYEILDKRSLAKPGEILEESMSHITISTIDYDLKLYLDGIDRLAEFSSCSAERTNELISMLCGIHDRNKFGWSPIIVAAYHGNITAIETLLKLGADINDVNNNGTSVLMYAKDYSISKKDTALFDFLLKNGADLDHRDFSGKKILDYISKEEAEFLGIKK